MKTTECTLFVFAIAAILTVAAASGGGGLTASSGGQRHLFASRAARSDEDGDSMTSTIRNITYDDLKLKAAKLERGFIHKCPNCGVNDKITGVEEGQKKHIVCPACKLGGTILASKKSLVLVTCPHCSDIVSYPGQAKEGVFKCAKCGNDYIVASPNTVNMLRTKYKGPVNYEGRWLTSNELLQAQFVRKMSSEGKIQYKGQWMSSNDWRHAKIANRDYEGLDKFYGNELNGKNHEDILPYYGKVVRMRGVVIKHDATDKHWVCATKYNSSGDQEAFSFEWDDDPPQLDSPYVVWGIVSGYTTGRVLRVTQGGMTKVKRMSSSGGSTKVSINQHTKISTDQSLSDNKGRSRDSATITDDTKISHDGGGTVQNEVEATTDKTEMEYRFNTVNLSNVAIEVTEPDDQPGRNSRRRQSPSDDRD